MRGFILLAVLSACAAPADPGRAGDFMPLDEERTWTYELVDAKGGVMRIVAVARGGDVRELPGEPRVRFRFVYGTPAGMDHDVTKSIYALSRHGPREYYFDAAGWSLWHDPPIPLLPEEVAVGHSVGWTGLVEYDKDEIPAKASIRVEGAEAVRIGDKDIETVRVRTVYRDLPLEVRRWFARGIGLVRLEVRVPSGVLVARLISHG
ncbi:MAG: hypothetical protein ACYTHK_13570 [Planctomycetota bacterium]